MNNYPRQARTAIVETAVLLLFTIMIGGIVYTILAGVLDIAMMVYHSEIVSAFVS